MHQIKDIELLISYIDPRDNDLLPINNDDNFVRALSTARPLLRLIIQRKGTNETWYLWISLFKWNMKHLFIKFDNYSFIDCIWIHKFTGDSLEEITGYGTMKTRTNLISSILGQTPAKSKTLAISNPHDFRQVSAIIDVDQVPETCRRVKLLKHGSDKPLGFYIR